MGCCKICCAVCLFILGVPLLCGGLLTMIFKQDILNHFIEDDTDAFTNVANKVGNLKEVKPYKDAVESIGNALGVIPTTPKPDFVHDPDAIITAIYITSMVVGGLLVLCGLILCCHGCFAGNKSSQPMTLTVQTCQPRINSIRGYSRLSESHKSLIDEQKEGDLPTLA